MISRRWLLQGLLSSLWMTGLNSWAWAATRLRAARMWPAQDYTRVTLESENPLRFEYSFVQDPPRLAVDLHNVLLDDTLRALVQHLSDRDPNVRGVRIAQFNPTTVRLVFDLYHAVQPEIFSLQPIEPYAHRLVFDLYPKTPPDPLELLIRESLQASPPSDPLGAFIAQQQGPTSAAKPAPPSLTPPVNKPSTQRLIVVALDPGHGGEDPGAIGPNGTREKDVVLSIAQRLRDRLNGAQTRSGHRVQVFMTRDGDFFVPLHRRVEKARRVQADLLVSIHADAFMTPRPQGASVFALSTKGASSAAARWMANKENMADLVGGIPMQGIDKQLQNILADMMTTSQIRDSLQLGDIVLGNLKQVGRLHKPKVEQAGFAVLKAPEIPSVLVETAFISNPEEEVRLRSDLFQGSMAEALAQGILEYFDKRPPAPRDRSL